MYKKLIYLLFILLTGVSCSEYLDQTGSGYLKISKISINADVEIQKLSRSNVASDIQIDIYQGSTIIKTYLVGDPALNAPMHIHRTWLKLQTRKQEPLFIMLRATS